MFCYDHVISSSWIHMIDLSVYFEVASLAIKQWYKIKMYFDLINQLSL